MKRLALFLAMLVGAAALPALAAQPFAGVNGYITADGAPVDGATVAVYRLPLKKANNDASLLPLRVTHANAQGFFNIMPLPEGGYYLVSASSVNGHVGCTVANLNHVVVSRVKIALAGFHQECDEINVRSPLVSSDEAGSRYNITIP